MSESDKYYESLLDQFFEYISQYRQLRIEECIIGTILTISGLCLCIFGTQATKILFSIVSALLYSAIVAVIAFQLLRI